MRSGRAPPSQVSRQEVAADFLSLNLMSLLPPSAPYFPFKTYSCLKATSYLGRLKEACSPDTTDGAVLPSTSWSFAPRDDFSQGLLGGLWVPASPWVLGPLSVLTLVSPSVGKP